MPPSLLLLALLLAGPVEANTLSPAEQADGWILLFDGQSTTDWEPTNTGPEAAAATAAGKRANWQVVDGTIKATDGPQGLLCTAREFDDYVLKVDFRATDDTNSGVFLRTAPQPADPAVDCYELQIATEKLSPFPTGSFVKRQKGTATPPAAGEWHRYEITAQGAHFVVLLDGQTVLDFTDPKPLARGRIGLQFNGGAIEFRNVKLKSLK